MDNNTERNPEIFQLGRIPNEQKELPHIPSHIQADTLFTFTTDLQYLLFDLKNQMMSPRYCVEDIQYLEIKGLKKLAVPMKCFCDITLHRLEEHLGWYGYYGLAFPKEWGMKNKLQPVQYINPKSEMKRDFSEAFSAALLLDASDEVEAQVKLKNYIFHQLMYFKPYDGKIGNRNTEEIARKCFTDECEWRFIPDVSGTGFEQAYYDEKILNAGLMVQFSNLLCANPSTSLRFRYDDLKYIIVKSNADFETLIYEMSKWELDSVVEKRLLSKIIVWDESKGDF